MSKFIFGEFLIKQFFENIQNISNDLSFDVILHQFASIDGIMTSIDGISTLLPAAKNKSICYFSCAS